MKVRVGGFLVGKAPSMERAQMLAAAHVMNLTAAGRLAPGQPIAVQYTVSGQVIRESEMFGPPVDFNDDADYDDEEEAGDADAWPIRAP